MLYELARQEEAEVAALRRSLDIDAGYLSRILARLERESSSRGRARPATGARR